MFSTLTLVTWQFGCSRAPKSPLASGAIFPLLVADVHLSSPSFAPCEEELFFPVLEHATPEEDLFPNQFWGFEHNNWPFHGLGSANLACLENFV